jgi:hypothetical protein
VRRELGVAWMDSLGVLHIGTGFVVAVVAELAFSFVFEDRNEILNFCSNLSNLDRAFEDTDELNVESV